MSSQHGGIPRLIVDIILVSTVTAISVNAAGISGLTDEPVTLQKAPQYITQSAREFLMQRDNTTARVWVFFTDKGVFDRSGFDRAASALTLTERAMKRRAKVGKDKILFVDLPVKQDYVEQVAALGGKLRRISRWLNAASFEVPMDRLEEIGSLPLVAFVRPVARYKKELSADIEGYRDVDIPTPQSPDALNYGPSFGQLNQINVPAVHSKGYTGQGVTLAIMDTGFRKSHESFALHDDEGRILAEWDFIFNDGNTANEPPDDWDSQWNHGTYIWATCGGEKDGSIYGPAYKANFILCKTEDVRAEYPGEEDNWVAALEFADSIGTDVITTSLSYSDWYTYDDLDGLTATITIAANTCDSLGIVMCNSMGNSGPSAGTLTAPADAFGILAVGAVNSAGYIASFSSRGPTWDGRTKPEVCAQGVSTYCASPSGDNLYTTKSGTSLSTPLVAGAACLLIEARPNFTPALIRQALMETASNAVSPDNTYGWGIIDLNDALEWGASFTADTTIGEVPLTVQFTGTSSLSPTSWWWEFGDDSTSDQQNPIHVYLVPGTYTVSMTVETTYGPVTMEKPTFIAALGDTLTFVGDSVFAGDTVDISVLMNNSQSLNRIVVPFKLTDEPFDLSMVDVLPGSRTSYFEKLDYLILDEENQEYAVELVADTGGGSPFLPPGSGEVLVIRAQTDALALGSLIDTVTTTPVAGYTPLAESDVVTYEPKAGVGIVSTKGIQRCDADYSNDGTIDIGDLTGLISYLFILTYTPPTVQSGDCNADLMVDIDDITYLIQYLFLGGPPPPTP